MKMKKLHHAEKIQEHLKGYASGLEAISLLSAEEVTLKCSLHFIREYSEHYLYTGIMISFDIGLNHRRKYFSSLSIILLRNSSMCLWRNGRMYLLLTITCAI